MTSCISITWCHPYQRSEFTKRSRNPFLSKIPAIFMQLRKKTAMTLSMTRVSWEWRSRPLGHHGPVSSFYIFKSFSCTLSLFLCVFQFVSRSDAFSFWTSFVFGRNLCKCEKRPLLMCNFEQLKFYIVNKLILQSFLFLLLVWRFCSVLILFWINKNTICLYQQ